MPYVDITCVRCGKPSRPMVSSGRPVPRYCGRECYKADRYEEAEKSLPGRFWSQVEKDVGLERYRNIGLCWEWRGYANVKRMGYGAVSVHRKMVPAHRVSWGIERGPIPTGLWVLHRCDNPLCVRPSHLFLGTHKDNMIDMRRKGRAVDRAAWCAKNPGRGIRGEAHPFAKLTVKNVHAIRRRIRNGETQQAVADRYGVKRESVRSIVIGVNWAWVTEEKGAAT